MATEILTQPLADAVDYTASAMRVWLASTRSFGDGHVDARSALTWSAALGAILEPLRDAVAADHDSAESDRSDLHRGMAMLSIAEHALDAQLAGAEGLAAGDLTATVAAGLRILGRAVPRRHGEPMPPELRIVT